MKTAIASLSLPEIESQAMFERTGKSGRARRVIARFGGVFAGGVLYMGLRATSGVIVAGILGSSVGACSVRVDSVEPVASVEPVESRAERPTPPTGGATAPLSLDGLPLAVPSTAGRTTASAPLERTEASRFALALPQDAAFLERTLPPSSPERYARFRERGRINVNQSHLQQLDFLPGQRLLLTSSAAEGSVRVYERESRRLLGNFPIPGAERFEAGAVLAWPEADEALEPSFLAATPRGLLRLSARTGELLAQLDTRPARALRWSADHQVLTAVTSNIEKQTSEVHFFQRSGSSLTSLGTLNFDERVDGLELSRDNGLLALSHYPSGDVRVIDLDTGADVFRIAGPHFAGDVAFSPEGRFLAVGGEGLLVVDLLNPARRAFYSQYANNISQVGFSPSGDAVLSSSFDGRIRVFALQERPASSVRTAATSVLPTPALGLSLLTTLQHANKANVYAFVFDADGEGLSSASGDQTIRWFHSTPAPTTPRAGDAAPTARFRSLAQWRREAPELAAPWPPPAQPALAAGHYLPAALSEPARPCRLQPGPYACKITTLYRMRECTVSRDAAGRALLTFESGNLLGLRGVVFDDGPIVRFEGWLTEASTIVDCPGCERQPIHGVLRGTGSNLEGLLTFRSYYDPYAPPTPPSADVKIEEAMDRFPVVLRATKR